jgi:glucan phosphoethanolaminetransferase (alkaline phosphatase superfamily)
MHGSKGMLSQPAVQCSAASATLHVLVCLCVSCMTWQAEHAVSCSHWYVAGSVVCSLALAVLMLSSVPLGSSLSWRVLLLSAPAAASAAVAAAVRTQRAPSKYGMTQPWQHWLLTPASL